MKTYFNKFYVAALVVLCVASCASYDDADLVPIVEVSRISVTAYLPSDSPIAQEWNKKDKVYLFANSGTRMLSPSSNNGTELAHTFFFEKWPDQITPSYVLYNYVDNAPYADASIGQDGISAKILPLQKDTMNVFVGKTNRMDRSVYESELLPVCAYLKLSITEREDIAALSVWSNQGKQLCGEIKIDLESIDESKPKFNIVEGIDSLQVVSSVGALEKGKTFILLALPSGDFTPLLWFTDVKGRRVCKKYETTYQLEAGKVVELKSCDKGVSFSIDPNDVNFGNEGINPGGEFPGEWED